MTRREEREFWERMSSIISDKARYSGDLAEIANLTPTLTLPLTLPLTLTLTYAQTFRVWNALERALLKYNALV